uniref:hypothetical protein n=1 Tax=Pedobacter schmidteae TaxID=2201271 RepID=UPI000EB3625F|nr:hypothetical protein [Pedobacter schmidteae]
MKLKLAGLFGLIVAVGCVFAFNANAFKRVDSAWHVPTTVYQFDPHNYAPGTVPSCPGDGKVCYIIIPATDLYTSTDPEAILDPSLVGRPKVDDFSAVGLGSQIQVALLTPGEVSTPVNGRTIIERN